MPQLINYNNLTIYHSYTKLADITLYKQNSKTQIKVHQYTNGFLRQFKKPDNEVTFKDFNQWLEWRTFPPQRDNKEELLQLLGISEYNRFEIIKKTHAVMIDDPIWVKFEGEELSYNDISLWNI